MTKLLTTLLLIALVTLACGSPGQDQRFDAPTDIIAALQAAGLEAEDPTPMGPDDYGLGPYVASGVHFLVPSLCPDCGGRAFVGSADDIEKLRVYYDTISQASAAFSSWVFVSPDGRALIQLNGDLPEARARQYQAVIAPAD